MSPASNAAALAGVSGNPNFPAEQRLACAEQALNYYVDRADKLEKLLELCRTKGDDCQGEPGWSGYADVARHLQEILA